MWWSRQTRILWSACVAVVVVASGCSKKAKLIDEGGMPAQLDRVKCGSSDEEVIRAYPDLSKERAGYFRRAGTDRLGVKIEGGKVVSGMIFDMTPTAGDHFAKWMEQLEADYGKGTFREAKSKAFYWDLPSGPFERILLLNDAKGTTLATVCRGSSSKDGQNDPSAAAEREHSLPSSAAVTPPAPTEKVPPVIVSHRKPLGLGNAIDAVLRARCDESKSDVKTETLTARTADLLGMPVGDVGHFRCALKGNVGRAKWDLSLVDSELYSLSIFGDAIKPGNQWSNNHFARIGAEFLKPLLTPNGQKRLDELVDNYARTEPTAVHWVVEHAEISLSDVLAGDQLGRWSMIVTVAPSGIAETQMPSVPSPAPPSVDDDVKAPIKVTASSIQKAGPGYSFTPANLIDGDLTTSWQPTGPNGAWIRLDFASEINVTSVEIANGFQINDKFGNEFELNRRIEKARIRFSDNNEQSIHFDPDVRGFVRFDVNRKSTTSVMILIDTTYPGTRWNDLAVSEIVVRGVAKP